MAPQQQSIRFLCGAWALVVLGALVLVAAYPTLPDSVVLYRAPWAAAPMTGPKSLFTVGRIPLMGAGQLGAATAMVFVARASAPWERFWRWLGLVAGVKTALECGWIATPNERGIHHAFTSATTAVVAAFVVAAVRWWRRGDLRDHPRLAGVPRVWLIVALGIWAAFALAPRLLA